MNQEPDAANKDRPLVTFALFAYNQECYIREAVEGAFAQAYQPLEIILSDDCSTDRTYEIIKEMAGAYDGPHKIILNKNTQNLGVIGHVNKIFYELSSGEWIVCAAGDDISSSERVETLWQHAFSVPTCRGAQSSIKRVDKEGRFLSLVAPSALTIRTAHKETVIGASAAYHRDTILKFPKSRADGGYEDRVFASRSLLLGEIISVGDPLVIWRRHGNNLSGKIGQSARDQVFFSFGRFLRGIIQSNIQQLSDAFYYQENVQHIDEIDLIQYRQKLARKIHRNNNLNIFSGYIFENRYAPPTIRFNPINWLTIIKMLLAQKLSE